MKLEEKIRQIEWNAQRAIGDLAEEFRATTLLSFCRRHRMTFLSGNGTWFFLDRRGAIVNPRTVRATRTRRALLSIEAQLSVPALGRDDLFGRYVRQVSAADWRTPKIAKAEDPGDWDNDEADAGHDEYGKPL